MAVLSGRDTIIKKRYLNNLIKNIEDGKSIGIGTSGKTSVIIDVESIKNFKKVFHNGDQLEVDKIIKNSSRFLHFFKTKDGRKFKLNDIYKGQFSGVKNLNKSDAIITAKQERASLKAIKMALKSKGIKNKNEFLKNVKPKLLEIYPEMNDEWEECFFQQQLTVYNNIKNNNFSYSRDTGFMEELTKILFKLGIKQKDNWNPADIWLVTEPDEKIKNIKNNISNLIELNTYFRNMWYANEIIGISLKKMSGKIAEWEEVNIEPNKKSVFYVGNFICKLSIKEDDIFTTQDSKFKILFKNEDIGQFQVTFNSKGMNNLKLEATSKNASKARLGKAPLDMVSEQFKFYKTVFNNKHQNYPKNAKDFLKNFEKYYNMFKILKSEVKFYINEEIEFKENFVSCFNKRPDIAMTKLMQLEFFYNMIIESSDKHSLATSLYFLAQKKGDMFGPFGKLY